MRKKRKSYKISSVSNSVDNLLWERMGIREINLIKCDIEYYKKRIKYFKDIGCNISRNVYEQLYEEEINKHKMRKVIIYMVQNQLAGITPMFLKFMNKSETDFNYRATYDYRDSGDDNKILKEAFTLFNSKDSQEMIKKNVRCINNKRLHNMSINDVVKIENIYYICKPFGWERIRNINILIDT